MLLPQFLEALGRAIDKYRLYPSIEKKGDWFIERRQSII